MYKFNYIVWDEKPNDEFGLRNLWIYINSIKMIKYWSNFTFFFQNGSNNWSHLRFSFQNCFLVQPYDEFAPFSRHSKQKKVKKKKTKNVKVWWWALIRGINAITTATEMVELVLESMFKNIIRQVQQSCYNLPNN